MPEWNSGIAGGFTCHATAHAPISFFICIFVKGAEIKTEQEIEIFHPLAHSSNVYNKEGWTRLKPGIQLSVQVSHVGDKGPRTRAFHDEK